jgi:general secretion pathway protein G
MRPYASHPSSATESPGCPLANETSSMNQHPKRRAFAGILLAVALFLAGWRVGSNSNTNNIAVASADLASIRVALELFYSHTGRFPTRAEGLDLLYTATAKGPYLSPDTANQDPWGRPYVYTLPAGSTIPQVSTLGADGIAGGIGENADLMVRPLLPVVPLTPVPTPPTIPAAALPGSSNGGD